MILETPSASLTYAYLIEKLKVYEIAAQVAGSVEAKLVPNCAMSPILRPEK